MTQNVKNPVVYFKVEISGLSDKTPLQLTQTHMLIYSTYKKGELATAQLKLDIKSVLHFFFLFTSPAVKQNKKSDSVFPNKGLCMFDS